MASGGLAHTGEAGMNGGHVGGGQHADDTGLAGGLARVDPLDGARRDPRTDEDGVQLAVGVLVRGVPGGARHLGGPVQPGHWLADAHDVLAASSRARIAVLRASGILYAFDASGRAAPNAAVTASAASGDLARSPIRSRSA